MSTDHIDLPQYMYCDETGHNFDAAKVQKKQNTTILFGLKVGKKLEKEYDFLQNENSE